MNDSRWTRHRPGAGLLLLLALVAALAWPISHWRGRLGHPLTGANRVELCTQLEGVPRLAGYVAVIEPSRGSAGACQWRDPQGRVQLDATLTTTRSASTDENVADLDRFYANWRDEVTASGVADLTERKQDGARRLHYRRGDTQEWLLDDHGIVLWLRSSTLDAPTLVATGEQIAKRLRKATP